MKNLPPLILLFAARLAFAQGYILSLTPPQNALNVPADTKIEVVFSIPLDERTLNNTSVIVYADITGLHRGEVRYDRNRRTLTFEPYDTFNAGERVRVTLNRHLRFVDHEGPPIAAGGAGYAWKGYTWYFTVAVAPGQGGYFALVDSAPVGGMGHSFTVGDLNGDRYPDVVVFDTWYGRFGIYLNERVTIKNRGLRFYRWLDAAPVGSFNGRILDADMDGDMDIFGDLAVLFVQTGHMRFARQSLPISHPFTYMEDLDNDGIPDLLTNQSTDTTKYFPDSLRVYRGLGDFRYEWVTNVYIVTMWNEWTYHPYWYDLDGNGFTDILLNIVTSRGAALILNGPGFNLKEPIWVFRHGPSSVAGISGADFDMDGDIDYIVPGHFRLDEARTTSIFLNRADGTLVPGEGYTSPRGMTRYAACGDVDGDGDIDIVHCGGKMLSAQPEWSIGLVGVALNDGTGHFQYGHYQDDPGVYQVGEGVDQVELVDMDLDGDLDIVGWESAGGPATLFVMENTTPSGVSSTARGQNREEAYLWPPRPNPFNQSTVIRYRVPAPVGVSLRVVNSLGREVVGLVQARQGPGEYRVRWDGRDARGQPVASGVYLCQLRAGTARLVRKVTVVR